jgi:predicted MPP superfamily phosphohydrolase
LSGRKNPARPDESGPARRRRTGGERRHDLARDGLELVLDRLFRHRHWAARLAVAARLQRTDIEVDRLLVPVDRPVGAPPLRIAFASDFHAGATTHRRVLEAACTAIADERPDLLLLGGDFVTTRAGYIDQLAPLLADIPAPLGKFAVFGNHDVRANLGVLRRDLGAAGIRVLENEVVSLPEPHRDVSILGLDDPIWGQPEYREMPQASVRIVLMHAPDGLITVGDRHFDLALCGHTHGGQIAIGGLKPYMPQGRLSRDFAAGLYRLGPDGERALIVSHGVGCSTVPIRLGARPQVHLLTLGRRANER